MNKILNYSFPDDLKSMDSERLEELAGEIREFLIDSVSLTGGHLASNLGAVELTIALHKVFDCYKDRIIWDVGHQSYVHKILTGRASEFNTLRQLDGLSGFPKQSESDADVFDTGHASNSISLAAGLAAARDLAGEDYSVISVIGDGALTGGLAFEGLNNLGVMKTKAIVIVNDNGMSISRNTGGIAAHLGNLRMSSRYEHAKDTVRSALNMIPVVGTGIAKGISDIKNSVKYALSSDSAVFESFGFKYIGPIDGHSIDVLVSTLESARQIDGPVLIHAVTTKGKGYSFAEEEPGKFHGIGRFDKHTGKAVQQEPGYSNAFGRHLTELALKDSRICAVYAAMEEGTGLTLFKETFPERAFDAGIAEEHAVTFAAGLAKGGLRPFVTVYSTFLQRAYDEIIEDVCIQKLPVIFAIDRAGCVGRDGETHHGIFDISYLSHMPGMTVLAPRDFAELYEMMEYALTLDGPAAIRYPRGGQKVLPEEFGVYSIEAGRAQKLISGSDVEIWACGNMVYDAFEVFKILDSRGIRAGVVNARFISPVDAVTLEETDGRVKLIVTMEDNILKGGFGSQISALAKKTQVLSFGWPDRFIEHGSVDELKRKYGLDSESVAERIIDKLEGK
ncbi:MAG: 1-deoxy-D-xylulose-5-phosphate synthase [Anaerovoracaceae bacterium]|nr:1-deoxy-D-xylulose-5-phosphate synthase [Anaerovoracaceae bacterium]